MGCFFQIILKLDECAMSLSGDRGGEDEITNKLLKVLYAGPQVGKPTQPIGDIHHILRQD